MISFWTRLLILQVFTLQALFTVGFPQTAAAAWKNKPTTEVGGFEFYGKQTSTTQAANMPQDPSRFSPTKMREWYGKHQNSALVHIPASMLTMMAVVGAIGVLKCMSNMAESPNCDELRSLAENSPYIATSVFIYQFLSGGASGLFGAPGGVIPPIVKQAFVMSAVMIITQYASDGLRTLANQCYDAEAKADQNTQEAMSAREQCEKGYKNWTLKSAMNASVPSIPALLASVYLPRAGSWLYSKGLEKSATSSISLVAFVFSKPRLSAFLHGSSTAGKLVFGIASFAAQYFIYDQIQSSLSMPWRRDSLAHPNFMSTFTTHTIDSAPIAYLKGHLGLDTDSYRIAHNLPKTEKPRTAGETVAEVEEAVLRGYGNWARSGFQFKHFDEKTCETTPGSNGRRVCEYPINMTDLMRDYARIQSDFRRLNIEQAYQSYYMWKVKLNRYWQIYNDTYAVYQRVLTLLAEAKKENRRDAQGDLVLPADAPEILRSAMSPEDPQLPRFEAPRMGYAITPDPIHLIVAGSVCGPFLQKRDFTGWEETKEAWKKHPSIEQGSVLRGPLRFRPPAIVKETSYTICDYKPLDNIMSANYEKTNVYDAQWKVPGQKRFYTGLLTYLAANVDESLLPTQNEKGEWDYTVFNKFWVDKLLLPTYKMWDEFKEPYHDLIRGDFFEAMFRKDYSHCIDSDRKRYDATLFADLAPENTVCQDNGRRLVNGPNVRTRLPIGISSSIYEEMRFKSQMLEFLYYSFQRPENRQVALQAYRAREVPLLNLVKDLTHSDFTKDDRYGVTYQAVVQMMREISLLFGMNLDQVVALAQKKAADVDLEAKTPIEKASANRLYLVAQLVTEMNNLLEEVRNYHVITNGVGGMESPVKDVVNWKDYSVVPHNLLLWLTNGLGWMTFQHYPKSK